MADFCKQCSIKIFGKDFGELAGLGVPGTLEQGQGWLALCEGCGSCVVNDEGECIALHCDKQHGAISPQG